MTERGWEVRPLRAGDVEAVFALERRTEGAAHWNAEEYRRMVEPVAARGVKRIVSVAVGRGTIVGFAAGRILFHEAEIENVAVDAEFRRQGIAAALVASLLDTCRRRGVTLVRLEVRESNVAAQALYESAGFKVEAVRRAYYTQPDESALVLSRKP